MPAFTDVVADDNNIYNRWLGAGIDSTNADEQLVEKLIVLI